MISAILLAAGESKRMGRPKLLLKVGRRTMIEKSVDTLLRSNIDELIVVLGYRAEAISRKLASKNVETVINPHYRMGMSTSIRRGFDRVDPRCEAVLIALADQPFIETESINHLLDTYRRNPQGIVLPCYRGVRGHPVILDRIRYGKEMERITGDIGCKSILDRHPEDVLEVEVDSEGVVIDIDSWAEYRARALPERGFKENDAEQA
jgi:molybdenum cofactor cytidylyltransferase